MEAFAGLQKDNKEWLNVASLGVHSIIFELPSPSLVSLPNIQASEGGGMERRAPTEDI